MGKIFFILSCLAYPGYGWRVKTLMPRLQSSRLAEGKMQFNSLGATPVGNNSSGAYLLQPMRTPMMLSKADELAESDGRAEHDVYGFEPVELPTLPSGENLVLHEIKQPSVPLEDSKAWWNDLPDGDAAMWRKISQYVADHESDNEGETGLGGEIWPPAAAMCQWLKDTGDEIRGTRVLELGAGTGVCGIYAAALGASTVLLTDGGSDKLCGLCRQNVEANRHLLDKATTVEVAQLSWDKHPPAEHFDWVLLSDCTYGHFALDGLARLLGELAWRNSSTRIIVSHEHRSRDSGRPWLQEHLVEWDEGDEDLQKFRTEAEKHALRLVLLRSERPQPIRRGESFRSWTADLSIFEVTRATA